jgi:uncharacterized protein YecE (DUF72 family)
MAVYIGTSGRSYDHWVDVLYPRRASSLERIDAYAREFDSVEVNNTFYRWPKDEADLRWWADRIGEWRSQGRDVFAYFNNDGYGHAVRNALRLRQLVGS